MVDEWLQLDSVKTGRSIARETVRENQRQKTMDAEEGSRGKVTCSKHVRLEISFLKKSMAPHENANRQSPLKKIREGISLPNHLAIE